MVIYIHTVYKKLPKRKTIRPCITEHTESKPSHANNSWTIKFHKHTHKEETSKSVKPTQVRNSQKHQDWVQRTDSKYFVSIPCDWTFASGIASDLGAAEPMLSPVDPKRSSFKLLIAESRSSPHSSSALSRSYNDHSSPQMLVTTTILHQ